MIIYWGYQELRTPAGSMGKTEAGLWELHTDRWKTAGDPGLPLRTEVQAHTGLGG